jgi:hypothetical protein
MAKIKGCEYCGSNKELNLVNLTKSVSVMICSDCYKIVSQVSKYPFVELILSKGGNNGNSENYD